MTNEEILRKAIEKAVRSGWDNRVNCSDSDCIESLVFNKDFAKAFWGEDWVCKNCGVWSCLPFKSKSDDKCDGSRCLRNKWERQEVVKGTGKYYDCNYFLKWANAQERMIFRWQYHLQQMVLEKNPVKYLEQFLV